MITYPDCYACLVRHAVSAVQRATHQVDQQKSIVKRILRAMADEPVNSTPVRLTAVIHRLIRSELGVEDLYRDLKEKSNTQAMNLLPQLYRQLNQAEDRLLTAAKFAIAGNIIDYGSTGASFDIENTLAKCQTSAFGIDDFDFLRRNLTQAGLVVYVGDNAGEIALDRLFIEEIKRLSNPEIIFIVRGKPILNDVTLEDARAVGIHEVARVISSGGDGPGCELDLTTSEVKQYFKTADLIISKGQGNYEALSGLPYPIFFLLKIKCPVIAGEFGAHKGDSVVKFINLAR